MLIQEMEAIGTHGTSIARAISIKSDGFLLPDGTCPLKRGRGCYFWESYDGSDFAYELARAWWEYKNKRGDYNADFNKDLTVITAEIKCDEEKFLDFLNPSVKGAFHTFYSSIEGTLNDNAGTNEEIKDADVYGMFLDLIQEKSNRNFEVFRVSVPLGGNSKFKAAAKIKVFGEPIALVVKEVSCIKSFSMEPEI